MAVPSTTATPQLATIGLPRAAIRSRRSRYWSLFRRIPALIAAIMLLLTTALALASPWVTPHNPLDQSLDRRLMPPVWSGGTFEFPLGTDQLGRDILSRLIAGAQISLAVGVAAVLISGVLGMVGGVVAGYYGGFVDEIIMRIADVRLAIPFILLVIAVIAVFGPGFLNIVIILGCTGWVPYARVVRAQVLSLREREFVMAARILGASDGRLMFRHILPNTFASAIVIGSLELAQMIVTESALSFLGLGVRPPTASWGNMLGEGRDYLLTSWWLATFPGLAIALTAVSVNLVGDWLRDVLDPRLKV